MPLGVNVTQEVISQKMDMIEGFFEGLFMRR